MKGRGGKKRDCTNPLGSAVYAGNRRKECFHSLLSLTPVFPTPGNYWHSSCSHDSWWIAPGQPNHRLCQSSSLFPFPLHPVFYLPASISPPQPGHIPSSPTTLCWITVSCSSTPPSTLRVSVFFHPPFTNVIKAPLHLTSLLGFIFQFFDKYVKNTTQDLLVFISVIFLFSFKQVGFF